jgi:general secretion pathway protein F
MLLAITIFILVLYIFLGFKTPRFAIITLPVVGSILFIFAASNELFAPAIVSLCIFPATLISILFMRHETDVIPWPKRTAKTGLIILICIIFLAAFSITVSSLLGVYIGMFMGFVFLYFVGASFTQRNATVAFVISTIGASIRQNLPLPMALQSASENIKYEHSQILRQISKWLVQGYSLSESVKRGFGGCPARITALIATGEKTGQVPQVMQAIEKDLLQKADDNKREKPAYPAAYFIMVLIIMSLIALGLSVGVIPKFSEVLKVMAGGSIPKSTQILVAAADTIFKYGKLSTIVVGIIFLAAIINIKVRFRPRRPQKPLFLSRVGDFIKWHLPISHWFENNYSTLQIVEVLRIYLNAGCTVNNAVANTIDLDVNYYFRKKLQKWLKQIEAGDNIADAARQCGLANSLSWAFAQQENPENTLPVLEMLESVYRSNYSYKVNLAKFIILPSTTICLGVMVGFVAYSVFSAIVAIIIQCANPV